MVQPELTDYTDESALNAGSAVISVEKAKALVALFARVTTSRDAQTFAQGFTEDCVVRFNNKELRGRDQVRDFMASSFSRLSDSYKCEKTLRSISGNVLGVTWLDTWKDPKTKELMKGRGSEFWIMRGDQIARWDAAYGMKP
jgi:nuclear transport factor 2 (NTF2) superfamily protein